MRCPRASKKARKDERISDDVIDCEFTGFAMLPTTIPTELLSAQPAVLTFSNPLRKGAWSDSDVARFGAPEQPRRVVVRRADTIRVEAFTQRQSFTTHHDADDAEAVLGTLWMSGFRQVLMQTPSEDIQVLRSDSRVTLRRTAATRTAWADLTADRAKQRPLSPEHDAALLHALDLATTDGTILAPMADKYRQLNHLITTALALPCVQAGTPLHIIDAGCGKAYLSIALVHVLRRDGRDVSLLGVDTNPHVIAHAQDVVQKLSMPDCVFTVKTLRDLWTQPPTPPTGHAVLLLALHACDTATDDALMAGLTLRADAMLVAPCCHHYVQAQLAVSTAPAAARLLLDDGITKERLGDLLTDTMRRDIVRAFGYDAHLQEFVALEHTMKNILLKAERRAYVATPNLLRVHESAVTWGVRPKLLELVEANTEM
ncbi:MAG: SAM-dependent methyltransferase [Candidatus Kapabacteria bacterium]|nr:SAM-dependent methyltransferase [Candidatus Kapabacteria bacterium]